MGEPPARWAPLHGRGMMMVARCFYANRFFGLHSPPLEGWQAEPDGVVVLAVFCVVGMWSIAFSVVLTFVMRLQSQWMVLRVCHLGQTSFVKSAWQRLDPRRVWLGGWSSQFRAIALVLLTRLSVRPYEKSANRAVAAGVR